MSSSFFSAISNFFDVFRKIGGFWIEMIRILPLSDKNILKKPGFRYQAQICEMPQAWVWFEIVKLIHKLNVSQKQRNPVSDIRLKFVRCRKHGCGLKL